MKYKSPTSFRQALEERLRQRERNAAEPPVRLRKRVVFERGMARLQRKKGNPWVLKGGFALELRLGERARMTKDLDLGTDVGYFGQSALSTADVAGRLRDDLRMDMNDGFTFVVPEIGEKDLGIPGVTAYRYSVEARLDGRRFETIRIDVGIGDPLIPPFDELQGSDLLSFADIPPVTIRATSRAQHFAEKIHALTRPFDDRINTRVKDLADVMLLIDLGLPDESIVKAVTQEIFASRQTHEIPERIETPPASWVTSYTSVAKPLCLEHTTVDGAVNRLNSYWVKVFA